MNLNIFKREKPKNNPFEFKRREDDVVATLMSDLKKIKADAVAAALQVASTAAIEVKEVVAEAE